MPSFIVVSYRFLVHAGKFQTGYDKPPLHTRYVDKTLSGIKAVQTLLAVMHDDTELFKQFMDDRGSGSPADAVDHVVRLVEVVQPCLQAGQHGHQDTVDSGVGHDQPVHVAVVQPPGRYGVSSRRSERSCTSARNSPGSASMRSIQRWCFSGVGWGSSRSRPIGYLSRSPLLSS